MNCPKCGAAGMDGGAYCTACGQRVPEDSGNQVGMTQDTGSATAHRAVAYAGFWLRAVAYVLDTILLGVFSALTILAPLVSRGAISIDNPLDVYTSQTRQFIALRLLLLLIAWIYFAQLESSPWKATLGKKALGLQVTDIEGNRISFGRASARYFGKFISGFILLGGFIMAGFTEKKQALHDILVGCLVIRKI